MGHILVWTSLILAIVFLVFWNVLLGSLTLGWLGKSDFARFYQTAQAFMANENMYLPNSATFASWTALYSQHTLNLNPPHFHLLFLPLTPFDLKTAYAYWVMFSFLPLGLWIRFLVREVAPNMTPCHGLAAVVGLLAFAGTGALVSSGQFLFIIFLPLTMAWMYARHGKWTQTGIFLGLAASLKLFFLIFVPFLVLTRQAKALTAFAVTLLGVYGLGLGIFGYANYASWFQALDSVDWSCDVSNVSLLGFLTRNLSETPIFNLTVEASHLITPLWLIGAGAIGILTLLYTTVDTSSQAVDRSFGLLCLSALLISPLGWTYYWFFTVPPLAAVVLNWVRTPRSSTSYFQHPLFEPKTLLFLMAIPGLIWPRQFGRLFQPSSIATISIGSIYFWSTMMMWISLVVDWYSQPGHSTKKLLDGVVERIKIHGVPELSHRHYRVKTDVLRHS